MQELTPTSRNPYRVSDNERVKLPREFFHRHPHIKAGESEVWMYMTPGGDVVVSTRDYTRGKE